MATSEECCNADELEAPAWINTEFFQNVLAQHLNEPDIEVKKLTISPASVKGDHYASVMFRTTLEYTTRLGSFSKSLIIKTLPEQEGHKKELLGDSHIFATEIAMYTKILPMFEQILRQAGDETTLCTSCIYYSLEPRNVMIFEDLVSQGFSVVRGRPANLAELKAALGKLAKWHAVSFKLLKEQPELFDELKYDVSTLPNFMEQEVMTKSLPNFIQMLGEVDGLEQYQKYFEPLRDNLNQRWLNVLREYRESRKPDGYYVLCHGDFHLRNMMFKDLECMLLDFQMSYVSSMANDVIYAIYMLFSFEQRRDNCDELINYYFETLLKTLTKIGYEGHAPCLATFRKQLFEKRHNSIFLLVTFLPFITYMRNGGDVADLVEDTEKSKDLLYEKEYRRELEYQLPRMVALGFFEEA
ncbi:maker223 [Drosophila busckii]|uniref:Maker223 n=1 Tax=Drosophila busckii TaxID=30019 RepID=A0A0M4EQ91_DROBS|nr:uncharacterized protein LOC108604138 [Drosophila busckii]ALC47126.1 maker223 [Drosophila busckii]